LITEWVSGTSIVGVAMQNKNQTAADNGSIDLRILKQGRLNAD
jgi:hypothetical protein